MNKRHPSIRCLVRIFFFLSKIKSEVRRHSDWEYLTTAWKKEKRNTTDKRANACRAGDGSGSNVLASEAQGSMSDPQDPCHKAAGSPDPSSEETEMGGGVQSLNSLAKWSS